MNKKVITAAIANEYIVSLYSYAMSAYRTATVVIVTDFDDSVALSLQESVGKDEQIIVLTRDDLEYGADVYSIELLHMQWKSVCEWGDDLLSSVAVPADKLRPYLEAAMRRVLIDLREAIARRSDSEEVRQWLLVQYDRLICGCAAYVGWEGAYDIEEMTSMIDKQWDVAMRQLGVLLVQETLAEGWMLEAHRLLLAVVEKIDSIAE